MLFFFFIARSFKHCRCRWVNSSCYDEPTYIFMWYECMWLKIDFSSLGWIEAETPKQLKTIRTHTHTGRPTRLWNLDSRKACGSCVDANVFDRIDHAANGMAVEVFVFQIYMLKASRIRIKCQKKYIYGAKKEKIFEMSVNAHHIGRHSMKISTLATSFCVCFFLLLHFLRRFQWICHLFATNWLHDFPRRQESTLHNSQRRDVMTKAQWKKKRKENVPFCIFLWEMNEEKKTKFIFDVRWMRALEINIIHSMPRAECEIHCGNIWSRAHFWLYTPTRQNRFIRLQQISCASFSFDSPRTHTFLPI